jgi:hypothetical protein
MFDVIIEFIFSHLTRRRWSNLAIFLINVEADENFLETMHFQLIATNEGGLTW